MVECYVCIYEVLHYIWETAHILCLSCNCINISLETKKSIFMAIDNFLKYTLGFLYLSSSGSANAQLPGFFRPWTFSLNIELNMLLLNSFMSCLHSPLGY